jgi:hypothetical protein
MITIKQAHTHKPTGVHLMRITNVQKDYQGTSGDRAILFRKCTCSKQLAFEYGSFKDMKALAAELKEEL